MSLVNGAKVTFKKVTVTEVADGEGGRTKTYVDGDSLLLAVVKTADEQKEIAGHTEVIGKYTLTGAKSISLDYHDIVKRVSDGRYMRILSTGADKQTPSLASLDMKQWDAEDYRV